MSKEELIVTRSMQSCADCSADINELAVPFEGLLNLAVVSLFVRGVIETLIVPRAKTCML